MRLAVSKEALLLEDDFDPEHLRSLHAEDEVDSQFGDLIGLDSQINVFRQLARQVKAINGYLPRDKVLGGILRQIMCRDPVFFVLRLLMRAS